VLGGKAVTSTGSMAWGFALRDSARTSSLVDEDRQMMNWRRRRIDGGSVYSSRHGLMRQWEGISKLTLENTSEYIHAQCYSVRIYWSQERERQKKKMSLLTA